MSQMMNSNMYEAKEVAETVDTNAEEPKKRKSAPRAALTSAWLNRCS